MDSSARRAWLRRVVAATVALLVIGFAVSFVLANIGSGSQGLTTVPLPSTPTLGS